MLSFFGKPPGHLRPLCCTGEQHLNLPLDVEHAEYLSGASKTTKSEPRARQMKMEKGWRVGEVGLGVSRSKESVLCVVCVGGRGGGRLFSN